VTPNLNDRQSRFLIAAYRAGPTKGTPVYQREIGWATGFAPEELDDIARELSATNPPILNRLAGEKICLATGRELARLIIETKKKDRRRKLAKGSLATVVTLMTIIVLPLLMRAMDRRIEKLEKAAPATTQPDIPTSTTLPGPTSIPSAV
jgi:hypothetical protein